jgi:hypothetical protein
MAKKYRAKGHRMTVNGLSFWVRMTNGRSFIRKERNKYSVVIPIGNRYQVRVGQYHYIADAVYHRDEAFNQWWGEAALKGLQRMDDKMPPDVLEIETIAAVNKPFPGKFRPASCKNCRVLWTKKAHIFQNGKLGKCKYCGHKVDKNHIKSFTGNPQSIPVLEYVVDKSEVTSKFWGVDAEKLPADKTVMCKGGEAGVRLPEDVWECRLPFSTNELKAYLSRSPKPLHTIYNMLQDNKVPRLENPHYEFHFMRPYYEKVMKYQRVGGAVSLRWALDFYFFVHDVGIPPDDDWNLVKLDESRPFEKGNTRWVLKDDWMDNYKWEK